MGYQFCGLWLCCGIFRSGLSLVVPSLVSQIVGVPGSRSQVWDSGCDISSSGFQVWDLSLGCGGLWAQDLRLVVSGLVSQSCVMSLISSLRLLLQICCFRFAVSDLLSKICCFRFAVSDLRFQICCFIFAV